jgi:N-acetylglucosamine-6-phosphate deacetylase
MTRQSFVNGQVLTPEGFRREALVVEHGRIVGLSAAPSGDHIDLDGGFLLPGFIDVQVNGGGGVLFNDAPTVDGIAAIAATHRRFGTTGLLPTLISDDLDVVDRAMRAVEAAIDAGVPGILGIHLEGPFLSAARHGTHDAAKLRRLNAEGVALLSSLKRGVTLVTLAPEACASDQIATLVAAGVVVSVGHTDADYDTVRAAFSAGATGVTHLYNAMSPFNHRAPGAVGAALENRTVYCGIIVDGRHVHPAALRVALAARPVDRLMLVTDAMPTVGTADKRFTLGGMTVEVKDGVCVNEHGVLAGSDLDMATALRNAVEMLGISVETASKMASTSPAAFLGLTDQGAIRPGMAANLVWMDRDLAVRGVWIAGDGDKTGARGFA